MMFLIVQNPTGSATKKMSIPCFFKFHPPRPPLRFANQLQSKTVLVFFFNVFDFHDSCSYAVTYRTRRTYRYIVAFPFGQSGRDRECLGPSEITWAQIQIQKAPFSDSDFLKSPRKFHRILIEACSFSQAALIMVAISRKEKTIKGSRVPEICSLEGRGMTNRIAGRIEKRKGLWQKLPRGH